MVKQDPFNRERFPDANLPKSGKGGLSGRAGGVQLLVRRCTNRKCWRTQWRQVHRRKLKVSLPLVVIRKRRPLGVLIQVDLCYNRAS